jgi:hypothetical protein
VRREAAPAPGDDQGLRRRFPHRTHRTGGVGIGIGIVIEDGRKRARRTLLGEFQPPQPFDGVGAVIAGDHEPQREAVFRGERLAFTA